MPSSRPAALGIDLGTSHTVAVVRRRDGRVQSLLFDSSPLLPSAVFISEGGSVLVGNDALHSARMAPARLEPHPKRRIDDGTVLLGDREWTVPELFAAVLSRVRRECVQVLGDIPPEVVITHPAVWGPARRSLLRRGCAAAGFDDVRLVPEPVAAANYFVDQLELEVPVDASIVVHDFGGGTFDAAVVTRTTTGFVVSSLDGLDHLGGTDIDAAIVADLRARVGDPDNWTWYAAPRTTADRRARHSFIEDVRLVKERLSRHPTADLYLPILDRDVHLTRNELEALARPLLSRAVDVVEAVIEDSGVAGLAGVFLVGGASRMPLVATLLHRRLGVAPIVVDQLEQVVAHGALLSKETEAVATRLPIAQGFVGRIVEPDSGGSASDGSTATVVTPSDAPQTPDPLESATTSMEARSAEEVIESPAEEISAQVVDASRPSKAEPVDPVTATGESDDAKTPGASGRSANRRSILVAGIGTIAAMAAIPLVMALNQEDDPVKADDAPSTSPGPSTPPRPAAQGWKPETFIENIDVRALAFSPDGKTLAVSQVKAVELWDVSGELRATFPIGRDLGRVDLGDKLRFSSDGELLVLARDGVTVWEVERGVSISSWEGDTGTPIAFSPNGTVLVYGDQKEVNLWDADSRKVFDGWTALTEAGDHNDVTYLAFSPDGEMIAGKGDNQIEVWSIDSGTRLIELELPAMWGGPVVFSPDGSLLAASANDGVQVWNVADWSPSKKLEDPNGIGVVLEFSPDGRTLLTDGAIAASGRVGLWDVDSWQRTRDDLFHRNGRITAATFSPDGSVIASGNDETVQLWRRD